MVNSSGTQDLLVHVLAKGKRYEAANYDNVAIPTNLDVNPGAKKDFPSFYASLFDSTLAKHPASVVTEYAWEASKCDPCPTPPMQPNDLLLLGGDVTSLRDPMGLVLTRLHARYRKDAKGEDLVFRQAGPLQGGIEGMEPGAVEGQGFNAFQGRYALRHPWGGPVTCKFPQRGIWGDPPPGIDVSPITPARKVAFAHRDPKLLPWLLSPLTKAAGLSGGTKLSSAGAAPAVAAASPSPASTPGGDPGPAAPAAPVVSSPAAAPAPAPAADPAASPGPPPPATPPGGGCAGCAVGEGVQGGFVLSVALGLFGWFRRRARPAR
jgi:hypothetical protein